MMTNKVISFKEELAEEARKQAANEMGENNFFSLEAGILSWQGFPVKDNTMNCIVLANAYVNALYGKYERGKRSVPACFALSETGRDMKPHENARDPQAEGCISCPHSEWGTGDNGKGKACKMTRRVALLPVDGDLTKAYIDDAVVGILRLPIMSVEGFSSYVKGLNAALKKPTLAVLTRVRVKPDVRSQFKVHFDMVEEVDEELVPVIRERVKEAMGILMKPYAKSEEEVELNSKY